MANLAKLFFANPSCTTFVGFTDPLKAQANAKIELVAGNRDSAARLQRGVSHDQPNGERLRPNLYFTTALSIADAAEGFTGSITTTADDTASVDVARGSNLSLTSQKMTQEALN